MPIWFIRTCDGCGHYEERTFTDSWTGKELCPSCLYAIIGRVAMSPQTESDNLITLMEELR